MRQPSESVNYMLRIDRETWTKARIQAITENRRMSKLIRSFLIEYGRGKYAPPQHERKKKK